MLNVKKTFALAIIALFIGLIAYSTAASITSSTNGTNFTFNLSGQPAMDNFSTIVCGVNMTCSQNSTPDNHTIYINSLGAGGGGGSGTVTQLNQGTGIKFSTNPITTTGTISANATVCNPANQASVLNSSGGFECVDNTDSVGITSETDPIATIWIKTNNTYFNGTVFPNSTNFRNDTAIQNNNDSILLRNGTLSRANITIDQKVDVNSQNITNFTNMIGTEGMINNNTGFIFNTTKHVDSPGYNSKNAGRLSTYINTGGTGFVAFTQNGEYTGSNWIKYNTSMGLTLNQLASYASPNDLTNLGTHSPYEIDFFGSAASTNPVGNWELLLVMTNQTFEIGKTLKVDSLAGNNKNITCNRADGTQYSGKINLQTGTCDY